MLLFLKTKDIIYTKPSLRNQLLILIMSNFNNIMSIERFDAIDASATNQDNLDLYISRIYDHRYTEDHIKHNFQILGIGIVDYADIVATKDPVTKEITFYSAFIKLRKWNTNARWYTDFIIHKNLKIHLSKSEFWSVFPSKKTLLPRSKVNTHQLAAYTDELFQKFEKQSKLIAVQQEMIDLQSKNIEDLLGKLEEQSAEIKAIKQQLTSEEEEEEEEEENTVLRNKLKCECQFCDTEYYDIKTLTIHEQICSEVAPRPSRIISGTFEYDLEELLDPRGKVENELLAEWENKFEKI